MWVKKYSNFGEIALTNLTATGIRLLTQANSIFQRILVDIQVFDPIVQVGST